MARYHAEGVHTVLVCCTGGEEGDILNPAMDTPEVRADIGRVRMAELKAATDIIGYDETIMLATGIRACPARKPTPGPTASPRRRWTRPSSDWWPSSAGSAPGDLHLPRRAERIPAPGPSAGARDLTAGVRRRRRSRPLPRRRPAFIPSKLYYSVWPAERFRQIHAKFIELGLKSPFDEKWLARLTRDEPFTTSIDIKASRTCGVMR